MFTGIITSLGEVVAIERRARSPHCHRQRLRSPDHRHRCLDCLFRRLPHGGRGRPREAPQPLRCRCSAETLARAPRSAAGNRAPRSTSSARSRSATSWAAIWYSVTPMESPPSRTGRTRAILIFRFAAPPGLAPYIAEKGSIAVDGTSLTVNEVAVPTSRSTSSPILRRSPASGTTGRRPRECGSRHAGALCGEAKGVLDCMRQDRSMEIPKLPGTDPHRRGAVRRPSRRADERRSGGD